MKQLLFRTKKIDPNAPRYATFHERLFATLIDLTLSYLIIVQIIRLLSPLLYWGLDGVQPGQLLQSVVNSIPEREFQTGGQFFHIVFADPRVHEYFVTKGGLVRMGIDQLVQLGILTAFFLFFWMKGGSTPGKKILRMRIVDANTQEQPTRKQCVIRFLVSLLSGIPPFIGIMWMIFNKKKQAWHDLAAGTVVIKVPKEKRGS